MQLLTALCIPPFSSCVRLPGSEGDGLTTALREINGWLMENRRQVRGGAERNGGGGGGGAAATPRPEAACGTALLPWQTLKTTLPHYGWLFALRLFALQEAGALPEEGSGTEVEEGSGRGLELVDAAMEGVAEAEEGLREALRAVDQYARSFDFDQEAYERTAARSAAVSRLLAVHGCRTSEELLRRAEEARRELEEFRELEAGGGEAGAEEGRLRRSVAEAAVALSCVRRAAAARLGEAVEEALGGLGMSGARFEARVAWEPAAAPSFSTLGVVEEGLEAAGEGRPGDEEGSALEGSGGPCREFRASSKGSLDRVEYLFAAGPQARNRRPGRAPPLPPLTYLLRLLFAIIFLVFLLMLLLPFLLFPSFSSSFLLFLPFSFSRSSPPSHTLPPLPPPPANLLRCGPIGPTASSSPYAPPAPLRRLSSHIGVLPLH